MARIITVVYINPGQRPKVKTVAVKRVNKIGNLDLKNKSRNFNEVTQND